MKSIFVLASLALSAFAQRATIIEPTNGTSVTPGSQLRIVVQQQNSPTNEVQVAIILGLRPCPDNICDGVDPSQIGIGTELFGGSWMPQFDGNVQLGFHQNFTIQVPAVQESGPSLLSLTHLELIGAANVPLYEQSGVTVNVV